MILGTVELIESKTGISTCIDEKSCSKLTLNPDLCGFADINQKCCMSCKQHCHDEIICSEYPSVKNLCNVSSEVARLCPHSCNVCSK